MYTERERGRNRPKSWAKPPPLRSQPVNAAPRTDLNRQIRTDLGLRRPNRAPSAEIEEWEGSSRVPNSPAQMEKNAGAADARGWDERVLSGRGVCARSRKRKGSPPRLPPARRRRRCFALGSSEVGGARNGGTGREGGGEAQMRRLFFFCTHTTTATATATPHPESTTSWLLRFLDHTLIFQFCYSRSSCCIREQIRRHFRWVSAKRTVKRFSARLQLCYKGRRAVKMPRFQVVIQFDFAVAAYR
jgi:hypothetical protein